MNKVFFHHQQSTSSVKQRRPHRSLQTLQNRARIFLFVKMIGFLGIGVLFILIFVKAPWFRVNTITCTTQFGEKCEEAVQAELAQGKGRHLIFGSWQAEITNIQHANPSYQAFTLHRRFPSKIDFQVTLSQPSYVLQYLDQKKVVTEAGSVVQTILPDQLPVISLPNQLWSEIDGQTTFSPNKHQQFLDFARCITPIIRDIQGIDWLSEFEIQMTSKNQKKAVLSVENCGSQLQQLQVIQNTQLDVEWNEVDLRFSKPVLKKV